MSRKTLKYKPFNGENNSPATTKTSLKNKATEPSWNKGPNPKARNPYTNVRSMDRMGGKARRFYV